jgi:hypothetical protein
MYDLDAMEFNVKTKSKRPNNAAFFDWYAPRLKQKPYLNVIQLAKVTLADNVRFTAALLHR